MSFTYSAKSAAFNVNAGQDHYTFHCTGGDVPPNVEKCEIGIV